MIFIKLYYILPIFVLKEHFLMLIDKYYQYKHVSFTPESTITKVEFTKKNVRIHCVCKLVKAIFYLSRK